MMKTQLNHEFNFEREFLQFNEWDHLASDLEIETSFESLREEGETHYTSTSMLWEELEDVNKFIDLAGY